MSGLVKQEQPKLEDTNMALYGSKVMTDLKKQAAGTEVAWKDAGKAVGIQVWRIEQFKVHAWPKDQYGTFFNGDAYIVLETYKGKDVNGKETDKLEYDIYFWLGKGSTQDERGTAAYKTVELDDLLEGKAGCQHRVVEGKESKHFLSLFPTLHIQDGGCASGFNHVKPKEYKTRLMAVLGQKARFVKVQNVACNASSMNQGEVFILDAGTDLWQWNGTKSNIWEKRKGEELVDRLVNSRNGKAKKKVLDGNDDDADFWKALGGKGPIADKPADKKDAAPADSKVSVHDEGWGNATKSLFLVKPVAGKPPTFDNVIKAGGKVTKKDLDSKNTYVLLLQHGDKEHHIFVWAGKGAGKEAAKHAMIWGVEFLKAQKLDEMWPVSRVIEGSKRDAGFSKALDA